MVNQEQGALLVQLAQWGAMMGLEEAQRALWANDFDPDTATVEDATVSRLLMFGETLGTLTKHGLLDTELVLDWLAVGAIWARLAPAVMKDRDEYNFPALYENFEALANQAV